MYRGSYDNTGVFEGPCPKLGKLKWKYQTDGWLVSAPVANKGVVYVGGADSYLYAINEENGELKWRFSVFGPIRESLSIHNEKLFYPVSPSVFLSVSLDMKRAPDFLVHRKYMEEKGFVLSKDPKSILIIDVLKQGVINWVYEFSNGEKSDSFTSPIVKDDRIYSGNGNHYFYSINAENGEKIWKLKTGNRISAPAAILGNTLYFGSLDRNLYAVDSQTGKTVWKYKAKGAILRAPALANNMVYFGDNRGFFYALNAKDGSLKWQYEANGAVKTTPALSDDMVYLGGDDYIMYGLNAHTGRLIWRFKLSDEIQTSPVICQNTIYFGSFDQNVYALEKTNGSLIWQFETKGRIKCQSAFISNGILFIGSNDKSLYAIR